MKIWLKRVLIIAVKVLFGSLRQAGKFIGCWLVMLPTSLLTKRWPAYWLIPIGLMAIVLFQTTNAHGQQIVRENVGERVPVTPTTASKDAPSLLSLGFNQTVQARLNIHSLNAVTSDEIVAADKAATEKFSNVRPGPLRVGLVRTVGPVPLSLKDGSALQVTMPDGKQVWTLAIKSPGAYGLRVHFTNFDVGTGSVIVYAQDANKVIARGPYTRKGQNQTGDFWTASLPGDVVFIEVSGINEPRLEVAEIIHFDKPPGGHVQGKSEAASPDELACHLDVRCESVDSIARDAIGQMNYVAGGQAFVCTGTILNDLDGETTVPYFLTARHCISTQAATDTLEVIWFWQLDSCRGALPNYNSLPRNTGGTLLGTREENDMSFIRLAGGLPGGIGLAGWSTATSTGKYGIHHPDGSWKRVTFTSNVGFCPTCLCLSLGGANFDYYDQNRGLIEGGSSGSGIFDNSGRLVGQLYGTCTLSSDSYACNTVGKYWAVYGEFEETYSVIKRWLEIGGTIHVDRNFTGTGLGTPSQPFRTVTAAYNFAWDGSRIKIKPGVYPETITFSKQVTILADGGIVTIGQ